MSQASEAPIVTSIPFEIKGPSRMARCVLEAARQRLRNLVDSPEALSLRKGERNDVQEGGPPVSRGSNSGEEACLPKRGGNQACLQDRMDGCLRRVKRQRASKGKTHSKK